MLVEVVYIDRDNEFIKILEMSADSTVAQAILESGVLQEFTHLSLEKNKVGVYGRCVDLQTRLSPNDRIEIYQPLCVDPMQARRSRAEDQK